MCTEHGHWMIRTDYSLTFRQVLWWRVSFSVPAVKTTKGASFLFPLSLSSLHPLKPFSYFRESFFCFPGKQRKLYLVCFHAGWQGCLPLSLPRLPSFFLLSFTFIWDCIQDLTSGCTEQVSKRKCLPVLKQANPIVFCNMLAEAIHIDERFAGYPTLPKPWVDGFPKIEPFHELLLVEQQSRRAP